MDFVKLRAWWFHRQGLDGSMRSCSLAECLVRCGWARSVGGSSPYLGFYARLGASRQAVDQAMTALEIHELPSARRCTYVVPAAHYPLALCSAATFPDSEGKTAGKLGVTEQELADLAIRILSVLKVQGPLDPEQLKQALGTAVRHLGEEGRKKGLTTTLPLALGNLQVEGRIHRIPVNGRLDQQRYRYANWDPPPPPLSDSHPTTLARQYFNWIGPATLAEFQWFSGLGVNAAKAAVEPLDLLEIGPGWLLPVELKQAFETFEIPTKPAYALVGSIDSMLLLRRNLPSLTGGRALPGLEAGVADLPSHAILDRGRLIGLWEYDTETSSIAWGTLEKADKALKVKIEQMEAFIQSDLGDARSFSLDSPKSRSGRIAQLRIFR